MEESAFIRYRDDSLSIEEAAKDIFDKLEVLSDHALAVREDMEDAEDYREGGSSTGIGGVGNKGRNSQAQMISQSSPKAGSPGHGGGIGNKTSSSPVHSASSQKTPGSSTRNKTPGQGAPSSVGTRIQKHFDVLTRKKLLFKHIEGISREMWRPFVTVEIAEAKSVQELIQTAFVSHERGIIKIKY